MKKIIISFLSLSLMVNLSAQDMNNLVENPSFEQTEGRIKRGGAIAVAVGWMSPTKASADLFAGKVKEDYGTPSNELGMEDPQDGENYVGIRAFSYNDKEARTYISSRLKQVLRKDQKYCVTFYVNLAEASKYASNNIGANFSKKQYNISEAKSILTQTHVQHKDNPVFSGQFGWDQVCGVYRAEGGEKFITIGNFSSNGSTENSRLKKSKDFSGAQVVSAYYYVDNISVVEIDEESDCKCQADDRTVETKFIYEVAPMSIDGLQPEQVASLTSVYYGYGDAEISKNSEAHLKNILTILLENNKAKIMVTSHLDENEAEDPELTNLGKERTEAIKVFLMSNGVNYTRILTEEKGNTQPADKAHNDLAKAKNRRVTFTFIK
ncbi:OmpA family protein [Crocinitomix algicola]|uniref:OmpA family protein n=1 Tax=Crocinitomix algicola TaxID=1740263 RepID=UPI0009F55EBC|nr:OmpA family protein [Crocinitomix algicola]